MQNSMEQTKVSLFVFQFKKVVGREPSPEEVRAGTDLEPGKMMDSILDSKIAEGKRKGA